MTAVWVDGVLTDAAQARVAALDHGVTVGDGVFETLKVVDGTPFALRRHLVRLRRSAGMIGLQIDVADDDLRAAAAAAVEAAAEAGDVGRVRITVTGGVGPLSSDRGDVPPTVIVAAGPGGLWEPSTRVATVPWTRNERSAVAGAKTTSYAENVVALASAHERGASEAILANSRGALCEGTGSNVFLARGEELVTPSLATGCLAGITRELLLELTAVTELDQLTFDDLRTADEAFLTSSTRDVQSVSHVDEERLACSPGPLTAAAATAFAELTARDLDP